MSEKLRHPTGLEERVEELEQSQRVLELQRRVLEMAARGAKLGDTLDELCRMIGDLVPNSKASVMEVIEDDRGPYLKVRSAPGAPEEARALLDGLRPSAQGRSCGTASFLGEAIIVSDTRSDPRWQSMTEVAENFGIRSCWSMPIQLGGETVATLAISQGTLRALCPTGTVKFESRRARVTLTATRKHVPG